MAWRFLQVGWQSVCGRAAGGRGDADVQDGGSPTRRGETVTLFEGAAVEEMSAAAIHPSALIAASAKLAPGVRVGAFAVVGDDVELGEDCVLYPHAMVYGPAKFGAANVFHPFCVVGGDPQDYTFAGENTQL